MKYLLLTLLLSFPAFGAQKQKEKKPTTDCKVHRIYCAMKKLSPTLDKKYAMKMSDLIYKYSKEYDLSPMLSVAIFMQESSLGVKTHRKQAVLVKMQDCIVEPFNSGEPYCISRYKKVEGIGDGGVWMFSVNTIINNEMDIERVMTDLEYTTEWHFKILSGKIKKCRKRYPTTAWACYNSATPIHHKRYVRLVMRWFNTIRDI